MSRLRVGDVDPVEEDGHLVIGAAADADVGLHAHRTPLTHIHAHRVLEQVIDRFGRRRCNRQTVHERHDPRAAVQRHRNPRRRDLYAVNPLGTLLRPRRHTRHQAGNI